MLRSLVKRSLPSALVDFADDLRRVDPAARGILIGQAFRRGFRTRPTPTLPEMTPGTIVAVCHGNILRSAYAEALLQRAVTDGRLRPMLIRSAGLHARAGQPADPRGIGVAEEQGHDLASHVATPLDGTIVAQATVILIMDRRNEAELLARHPEAGPKLIYLGSFAPSAKLWAVIPDPYTGDLEAVRVTFRRVEAAVDGLVRTLSGVETSQGSPESLERGR